MKQPHEYTTAERAQAYQAWIEGKEVEYHNPNNNQWYKLGPATNAVFGNWILRLKPTPNYRPFKPEEVPVGRIVKIKNGNQYLITASLNEESKHSIRLGVYDCNISCADLLQYYTFADDGTPCGVLEG